MNEDPILSPAQNDTLSRESGFYCEWNGTDDEDMCRKLARRINSETFRCPEHLPIAINS